MLGKTSMSKLDRFSLDLEVNGFDAKVEAEVPCGEITLKEILPAVRKITDTMMDLITLAVEAGSQKIGCRPSCGACCKQLVPINVAEVERLRELVKSFPKERKEVILERFEKIINKVKQAGMYEELSKLPTLDDDSQCTNVALSYFDLRLDCPFLENNNCSIREDRPLVCREYLVTSDPSLCELNSESKPEMIQIASKPSNNMYQLGAKGNDAVRWFSLTMLFEEEALNYLDKRKTSHRELLERFVDELTEKTAKVCWE